MEQPRTALFDNYQTPRGQYISSILSLSHRSFARPILRQRRFRPWNPRTGSDEFATLFKIKFERSISKDTVNHLLQNCTVDNALLCSSIDWNVLRCITIFPNVHPRTENGPLRLDKPVASNWWSESEDDKLDILRIVSSVQGSSRMLRGCVPPRRNDRHKIC